MLLIGSSFVYYGANVPSSESIFSNINVSDYARTNLGARVLKYE